MRLPRSEQVGQLLRAALAPHPSSGRIQAGRACDQGHVRVPHQRNAARPHLQARQQLLKMLDRHSRGDHARKTAIRMVVATGKDRDPGAGNASVQQLARQRAAIIVVPVHDEKIAVAVVHADTGGHAMPQQDIALLIGDTQLRDLRQPAFMEAHLRHHLRIVQRRPIAQGTLQMQLHLTQGLVDPSDRGRHTLVQQPGQVVDRGAHLGLLAQLGLPQGHREQPDEEQVQGHDRRHQGQENGLSSLLHDGGGRRGRYGVSFCLGLAHIAPDCFP